MNRFARGIVTSLRRVEEGARSAFDAPRIRIGLAIGERSLRAVGLRRSRVEWAFEGELDPEERIDVAVGGLLARVPRTRWTRAGVVAAVGPSRVQVKKLAGLPDLRDPRALALVVRENADRFFLRTGSELVVSDPWRAADGSVWAAALNKFLIDDIRAGCAAKGFGLNAVLPAVAILGIGAHEGRLVWQDGHTRISLSFADGDLTGLTRLVEQRTCDPISSAAGDETAAIAAADWRAIPALRALGDGSQRFLDAVGAAMSKAPRPMGIVPERPSMMARPAPPWRVALAGGMALMTAASAAMAPAVRASFDARERQQQLAALGDRRVEAARIEAELRLVTEALARLDEFAHRDVQALRFLSDLARDLPRESAVAGLRIDSLGGSMVVLGVAPMSVMAATEQVRSLTDVELAGAVTHQRLLDRDVERATVRFRLKGASTARDDTVSMDSRP